MKQTLTADLEKEMRRLHVVRSLFSFGALNENEVLEQIQLARVNLGLEAFEANSGEAHTVIALFQAQRRQH